LNNLLNKIDDINIKKGLKFSVFDGILWAVMFGTSENYIVPFVLLFNATLFQISLLQGFAQLGAGFSQLLGSYIIHKYPHRKRLAILGNIIHALSWVFIFLFTFFTKNVWFSILFFGFGILCTNLAGPGWISWMNDLVPEKLRGQFWGMRNRTIGLAQFISILIAGVFLFFSEKCDREFLAFGILFAIGFSSRFSSIFVLKKQYEPKPHIKIEKSDFSFLKFLPRLFTTNFGRFVLFIILITFSINLMAPLIPAYLLKGLNFNYLEFTIIIMTSTIFSFIFMTYWGPFSDKYGNYRVLYITAIALPLLPLMWIFLKNFYLLLLLQVFSGFVWAGFNLSLLNYIFDAVKRENVSKISGYYNFLNTTCAFLGSFTGGLIATSIAYFHFSFFLFNEFTIVFALSCLLRIIIVVLFRTKFKEVRQVEKSPSIRYFYIYRPATNIINRFLILRGKLLKPGSKKKEE
jgi:MFS family permease